MIMFLKGGELKLSWFVLFVEDAETVRAKLHGLQAEQEPCQPF